MIVAAEVGRKQIELTKQSLSTNIVAEVGVTLTFGTKKQTRKRTKKKKVEVEIEFEFVVAVESLIETFDENESSVVKVAVTVTAKVAASWKSCVKQSLRSKIVADSSNMLAIALDTGFVEVDVEVAAEVVPSSESSFCATFAFVKPFVVS